MLKVYELLAVISRLAYELFVVGINRTIDRALLKAPVFFALAACILFFGCGERSDSRENSAVDIRGQPISASVSVTNAGLQAVNMATTRVNSAASDYVTIGFDRLSGYPFELSDDLLAPVTNSISATDKIESRIPKRVKELNQKRIGLTGFMLPLKVEKGLVTELLIMKDQSMCCYGVQPKINEWVSVKMVAGGVKAIMDQPVTLFGKLHVGEMRENGYLVGIYAMDGEKMQTSD